MLFLNICLEEILSSGFSTSLTLLCPSWEIWTPLPWPRRTEPSPPPCIRWIQSCPQAGTLLCSLPSPFHLKLRRFLFCCRIGWVFLLLGCFVWLFLIKIHIHSVRLSASYFCLTVAQGSALWTYFFHEPFPLLVFYG